MPQDDGRFAHVVQIAYELARTGDFKDFNSIEREVFAEGVHWIERPAVRRALDEICDSNSRRRARASGSSNRIASL
jgi:hypothetical protein